MTKCMYCDLPIEIAAYAGPDGGHRCTRGARHEPQTNLSDLLQTYKTVIERMLVASLYVGASERVRNLGLSIGASVKSKSGEDEVVWKTV